MRTLALSLFRVRGKKIRNFESFEERKFHMYSAYRQHRNEILKPILQNAQKMIKYCLKIKPPVEIYMLDFCIPLIL